MGVHYLAHFLHTLCPNGTYPVNLESLIQENVISQEYENTLVIDGSSFIYFACTDLDWICGGQVRQYEDRIFNFCDRINALGCKIVVIFSGTHLPSKQSTWIFRSNVRSKRIMDVFRSNPNINQPNSEANNNFSYKLITADIFKKGKHVEVYYSLGANDQEVAKYVKEHNCLALLGEDSDYVIYDGGKYYLSAKYLNLETLETKAYNREGLLRELNLKKEQLPLFSILMGNEFIIESEVKAFHQQFLATNTERFYLFYSVAKFIKSQNLLLADYNEVSQIICGDNSLSLRVEDCINAYTYNRDSNIEQYPGLWGELLDFVAQKHKNAEINPQIMDIMYHQKFYSINVLENFLNAYIVPISVITRKIRRHIYSILLSEKPKEVHSHDVVEYCIEGQRDEQGWFTILPVLVKVQKPLISHPGLQSLWSDGDVDLKWNLFCSAIHPHLKPRDLKRIKPHFIIPTVALYFLYKEKYFSPRNIKAFLIQAVQVKHLTIEDLQNIQIVEYDKNAVELAARFVFTIANIELLNSACGNVVSPVQCCLTNYFDGKLFHQIYQKMKYVRKIEYFNLSFDADVDFNILNKFIF